MYCNLNNVARARRVAATDREPLTMEEKSILLVEDNPDDVDLTIRVFKRNNIKKAIVAKDGRDALRLSLRNGRLYRRIRRICRSLSCWI